MTFLVGDIGGTHTRFALSAPGSALRHFSVVKNRDHATLEAALEAYLAGVDETPDRACLAVAGPVVDDAVRIINHDWAFSQQALGKKFGFSQLIVTNDFTALAMGVPFLSSKEFSQVGGGKAVPDAPMAVIGPGTGLGVSGLLRAGDGYVALSGEGGHASFAPGDAEEIKILEVGWKRWGHLSAERIVSGDGLVFLHEAIAGCRGIAAPKRTAPEITEEAKADHASLSYDVVMRFCGILGSVAGNLALTLGAHGGVYIGGGIVPKLGPLFAQSPFRARFEGKGRFAQYLQRIPTFVIAGSDEIALKGGAAMLSQSYGDVAA